ncbi:fimbrial protein [Serratia liquefaciens]|uniref:fimbrial protein n=1 Tax=Serratia liquefaciens TaxID=614 RepID=UPI00165CF165|nr:fimbrial protein [Serratia liquefaciens]QNQ55470.1 fimbrial protein [Serratia liquefaciens]
MTLLAGAVFSFGAYAADGTITITGEIIDAGCNINGSGTSPNIPIVLGQISKTGFTDAGDTSGAKAFDIRLSSCPSSITGATVSFSGPADTANNQILAVTGGAAGVGVGLYEENATTLIPLGTSSVSKTLTANAADFRFYAKYVATAAQGGIKAGQANANADFTINYN